jgi:hypothetical protein
MSAEVPCQTQLAKLPLLAAGMDDEIPTEKSISDNVRSQESINLYPSS